jgi:hypothetical protein
MKFNVSHPTKIELFDFFSWSASGYLETRARLMRSSSISRLNGGVNRGYHMNHHFLVGFHQPEKDGNSW